MIREIGESVLVCFPKRELNVAFRIFVAEESRRGHNLAVDELLLLQFLLQHSEVDTATAAALCQRSEPEIRERLATMEGLGYIEHGGAKRGAYWCIHPTLYARLVDDGQAETRRRIDWEAAKTRVLSILIERARRGEPGLSNQEVRQITHFDRNQVSRLMRDLRRAHNSVRSTGYGAGARYEWREG